MSYLKVPVNAVFIWNTPEASEDLLVALTKKIIEAIKNWCGEDVVVFYPTDKMRWDAGKEIAVYLSGPNLPKDNEKRQDIAETLGEFVIKTFKPNKIYCSVLDEPKYGEGYWARQKD